MDALAEVVGIKLVEKLREDESGTYTSSVSGGLSNVPYDSYNFRVFFPCGPENVERLIKVVKEEIDRVVANGPDAKDLAKFKEAEINDYREKGKENRTWLNIINSEYTKSGTKERYLNYLDRVNALTASDVQAVAEKYLTGDYVQAVLYPEKVVEAAPKQDVITVTSTMDKSAVLDKYYNAIGGKDALENMKSAKMLSEMAVQGMSMNATSYQMGKDKMKNVIDMMGMQMVQVVNGDTGYMMQGGQRIDMQPAQVEEFKKQTITGIIRLPADEIKEGVGSYKEGEKTFLVLKSDEDTFTFDGESGLLVKQEAADKTKGGVAEFSDWKDFGGIKYPTTIKMSVMGQNIEQKVKEVIFNSGVSEADFE